MMHCGTWSGLTAPPPPVHVHHHTHARTPHSCTRCTPRAAGEFAGAAQSLGAGSILVNPWNISDMATAIEDALSMSEEERRERHRQNYMHVQVGWVGGGGGAAGWWVCGGQQAGGAFS